MDAPGYTAGRRRNSHPRADDRRACGDDDLHTVTLNDGEAPRLVRVWGYYNAFATWCLLGFCVSGVYLWLTAQARSLWAWSCVAAGTATMTVLWVAFR